jgi:isoquinoline 1-oxidoreductase subunit beta
LQALALDIAAPSPLASQIGLLGFPIVGPDMQIVAGAWNAPYNIPHFRVSGYHAENLVPVSSWRSVGASARGFFREGFWMS